MLDGPAIATIIFLVALGAARGVFVLLQRRSARSLASALEHDHLVHWRYARDEWRAYCEAQRSALWFDCLRPGLRMLVPGLVLAAGLSVILELRMDLAPGATTLVVLLIALAIASTLLGPWLREFVSLSMRRRLDYELYLGEAGVLEVWRDDGRVEASEEHLFGAAGRAIERVEANGVAPAEIVFSVGQPLAFGMMHTEEHYLVPQGRLAEAREIAQRLTPQRPGPGASGQHAGAP